MSTRMKGLFKGIRYISQIFEEEQQKDQDIQIGLPTDVKHVAHVGWDGPADDDDSRSWMKDSNPSTSGDSQPNKDSTLDSKRAQRAKKSQEKEQLQLGEGPKPSRRRSTDNANATDTSPKKPSRRLSADNATAKPRPSRRSQAKDSSADGGGGSDVSKKTRRKKSESSEGGGTRRPRSKATGAATSGGVAVAESGSDTAAQKPGFQLSEDDEER